MSRSLTRAAIALIGASLTLGLACGEASDAPVGEDGGPVGGDPDGSRTDTDGAGGNDGAGGDGAGGDGGDGATGDGATDAPVDAVVPAQDAGPPAVRFIGRFDTRDAAGPTCAWPGCRIIANFSGTGVSVKLNELKETWFAANGGPSEWDVIIDGALKPKLEMMPGTNDYVLAAGLPAGPHRVEIYKRSETQNGYTQFLGYDFGGGTLLPPPLPATRRIEIVGDSAPAAFGIEGDGMVDVNGDCPGPKLNQGARWQNFRKSFGQLIGDAVSADVHGTVYSGKGLVKNIYRPDTATMPLLYPLMNPVKAGAFDFTTYVPDAIILMIGGNDFAIGQPTDDGATTLADFTQATRNIVATFRARAAQAHVFLTLSPSVSDAVPAGRNSRTNVKTAFDTVAAERVAAGDTKVYSIAPPVAQANELTGCNGHGNPAYHVRVAQQITVDLKAKTGW